MMTLVVLLVVTLIAMGWQKKGASPSTKKPKPIPEKTGPAWEQDEPWVLDMDESDL